MSPASPSDPNRAYWAFAALGPFALYGIFVGILGIPFFQRQALYAHKIHTLWWNDVKDPEKWGFAKNQVTPFTLPTSDGVTLYLWHILPLATYTQNETTFLRASRVALDKYTSSDAFRILRDDPEARLILSFHGNAGHIAQNTRAPQFHMLSNTHPKWHVISLDYRGFGHSSGAPNEEGLITDASTLVEFALTILNIPPSRILLLGQSLGTAVAAATAEKFSCEKGIEFAGVVLVAPFSSLPTMLANYSLGGVVPLLRPLRIVPPLLRGVLRFVVDKWKSLDRLSALAEQTRKRGGRLRLSLVAAADDWDIPCVESVKIFEAVARASIADGPGMDERRFLEMKDERTDVRGKKAFKITWQGEGDVVITHEQFAYGGHNDIMVYAPVNQAIMAVFGT
ncbi:alpha/beta-hydrolase [Cryphonectria parasitica EP155]|uniref:Alpha/beta-hydrolase n=1 Tax=Cryphonectria parasitica (strain ATCC 38755 / EP155) TaxID=660469 RepID=A0A9P5CMQ7_CRYP1|nr:alpha/beta-hydrolase [Cryphonectria parasitica EP155]KAF3764644.1 alpha/beta-hydrolase [Cryphonectria parasitica EP155]